MNLSRAELIKWLLLLGAVVGLYVSLIVRVSVLETKLTSHAQQAIEQMEWLNDRLNEHDRKMAP